MSAPELGEVHGVPQVVVALAPGAERRLDAGVRRELASGELQVVRAVAEGVDDAAVPAGQPGARLDGRTQAPQLVRGDLRHRHRLHDQVGARHRVGVGVDRRRLLDAHLETLGTQERDEQVGGGDRRVAVPATPNDQRSAGHGVTLASRGSVTAEVGSAGSAKPVDSRATMR